MTITAKFASNCPACGHRIQPGTKVEWTKGSPARHTVCQAVKAAPAAPAAPAIPDPNAIHLSGGSGYGCVGWTVGDVILSGEKRRRAGGPDGLVILTARRQYVREDGLSFGVGDESGYLYSATARPATAAELAPEIARAHEQALEMERGAARKALVARFRAEGVCPLATGQIVLIGEEVPLFGCRRRIYGSGTWAVIEPEGERAAPAAGAIESARVEAAALRAEADAAQTRLTAWTAEHLPADAPTRRSNNGRAPHDGRLYGRDLEALSPADRPIYDALLAETQRLTFTASPASYHHAETRLRDLEQAALLAAYPRSIWLVEAHGADGDDWSRNNIRTQGAGALGCRLPWTSNLDALVRSLREQD